MLAMLAACGDDGVLPMPDAETTNDAPAADAGALPSDLGVPIGGACSRLWCANYDGICDRGVCRPLCDVVDFPFCH